MVLFDSFSDIFGVGILFAVIFGLVMFALMVFVFVFWILMLVDCVKRKFKEGSDKIVWVLVIIFTGLIGALIYYFIVKVKDKRK